MKRRSLVLLLRNIAWAVVIFILCMLPVDKMPKVDIHLPHIDKAVHFGMFFIMAVLLCHELEYQTKWKKRTIYFVAASVAFAYGGIIEILQAYCFHRSGDVWDLVADICGAVAGCTLYPLLIRWKNRWFMPKSN